MANKLYNEASIQDIANAIREKNKTTNKYKVSQMGNAIREIKSGESLQEYSQMNPIVTRYMNEVTYDETDYTASQVLDYSYTETDYTKWYPTSYNVDIEESGILHLADELSVIKKDSIVGTNTLENSIPNEVAHWWNTIDGSTTQHGTIKPLGQVRMIKTTANNVRDLGGWACDGGTIKYGKLFRGGFLNASDVDVLVKQCGIRHDLDLRGLSENGGITSSPLGKEIEYTCTNDIMWYSLENEADWKTTLSKVFEAVAHNEPLIFHCSAGADRTGTFACIIEAILGVSQPNLDKDFELTTFAVHPNARRRTDENWTNLISEINAIDVGSTFRDKVINWVGYLGFTQDEINAFRKSMINGTPSDIVVEEYEPSVPSVNYFNIDTASLNTRIGSSGSTSSYNGMVTTDFIEVDSSMIGRMFKISGVTRVLNTNYNYSVRTGHYDENKAIISTTLMNYQINENNIRAWYENKITSDKAYIRISIVIKDNVAITKDDVANLLITLE